MEQSEKNKPKEAVSRRADEAKNSPEVSEERVQEELLELREALSRQDESIQGYLEQIKRLQADFENWRKRVEQEKLLLIENASSVLLTKLLPVLDNFERALTISSTSETSTFKEGMELIYRQVLELLRGEGVTPIEAVGSFFDPKLHEAYAYEESEEAEDHKVVEEARKGYLFKGKVLRPSLVKVIRRKVSADKVD